MTKEEKTYKGIKPVNSINIIGKIGQKNIQKTK